MSDVIFSAATGDVDWTALKAALVADHFDNGRTPEQYRLSHERSHAVAFARTGDQFIGNGRILSDGVCNAYLVDIWTATRYRRRGVGREILTRLLRTVPGQHVGLFTDDMPDFYRALGFEPQRGGMNCIVGTWLNGARSGG
ncbi:MAG: GNAT family N-acetyltransferase [Jatrophihabitantaceae bacterium]